MFTTSNLEHSGYLAGGCCNAKGYQRLGTQERFDVICGSARTGFYGVTIGHTSNTRIVSLERNIADAKGVGGRVSVSLLVIALFFRPESTGVIRQS